MTLPRLAALVFVLSAAAVAAQVPVTQDPSHKVVFDNPQFRILSVNVAAGATTMEHRHEFDIATVSMNAGTPTRLLTAAQPSPAPRPARPMGDAAITDYTTASASHRIENTGTRAYQLFAVENLKKGGWSTAPAATGLGTTMARESRAFRIYDVRLSLKNSQSSHTHAVPTIAVLVGGKVLSDGPDTHAKANAPAPVGLRQLDEPGQWLLVPAGDRHHIVRLGTADAHVVEIEVR